jgi:hypothetical protein
MEIKMYMHVNKTNEVFDQKVMSIWWINEYLSLTEYSKKFQQSNADCWWLWFIVVSPLINRIDKIILRVVDKGCLGVVLIRTPCRDTWSLTKWTELWFSIIHVPFDECLGLKRNLIEYDMISIWPFQVKVSISVMLTFVSCCSWRIPHSETSILMDRDSMSSSLCILIYRSIETYILTVLSQRKDSSILIVIDKMIIDNFM